jgi:hypothetical protein
MLRREGRGGSPDISHEHAQCGEPAAGDHRLSVGVHDLDPTDADAGAGVVLRKMRIFSSVSGKRRASGDRGTAK